MGEKEGRRMRRNERKGERDEGFFLLTPIVLAFRDRGMRLGREGRLPGRCLSRD